MMSATTPIPIYSGLILSINPFCSSGVGLGIGGVGEGEAFFAASGHAFENGDGGGE